MIFLVESSNIWVSKKFKMFLDLKPFFNYNQAINLDYMVVYHQRKQATFGNLSPKIILALTCVVFLRTLADHYLLLIKWLKYLVAQEPDEQQGKVSIGFKICHSEIWSWNSSLGNNCTY